MTTILGRKPGEIYAVDLADEYVIGCNQGHLEYEFGSLDEDSYYVNLKRPAYGWKTEDLEAAERIADHVTELMNFGKRDGKEWVRYSEPNWWSDDGTEVDELDDTTVVQYMIYEEDK